MKVKAAIEMENANILQTYDRFEVVIEAGEGSKLYDVDGKEYIDMTSGIGVNSLGYNNKALKNAITLQMDKVFHTSNIFYNPANIQLAAALTSITGMSKVFLCNSGAEANECAIKIARKYGFLKGQGQRNKIITLKDSFHGRTITTLAATGQEKYHNYFFPFTEGFTHVELNNVKELECELDDTVCAIMIEAIQGEGGIHPMEKEFAQAINKHCKEKDLLLIFDEIQCGIGRTGKFYAYEEFGIEPDIVTSAKGLGGGLPIGAVLVNSKLENVLSKGDHGSTFGGNPLAAAAALEVVKTISDEKMLNNIEAKGNYIEEKLESLHNNKIVEIRGKGLMIGVELNCEVKEIIADCIHNGVLFLSAGKNVIRMLPPLIISYEEIDEALNTLSEALN
jgi:acetylornithine/N-succinyldiaminopimelate aminotransferase